MEKIHRILIGLLICLLGLSMIPFNLTTSSPAKGELKIPPDSDLYVASDCSRCRRLYLEEELRLGVEVVRIRRTDIVSHLAYRCEVINRTTTLLKFNLSKIPPGGEIHRAELHLFVMDPPPEDVGVFVYALQECYDENYVSWTRRTVDKNWRVKGGTNEPDYLDKGTISKTVVKGKSVSYIVTDYVVRVYDGQIQDCGLVLRPSVDTDKILRECPKRGGGNYYVDFFSKEGAVAEGVPRYAPYLYVEFTKPTAILSLSTDKLTLEAGSSFAIQVSESGTYPGPVELRYKIFGGGSFDIKIGSYSKKPGFSVNVNITAKANTPPGTYTIEFYPVTPGYDASTIEYGKANLTVVVKGKPVTFTPTETETTETTSQTTQPGTTTLTTPPVTIPTTTSQPQTTSQPSTTSTVTITQQPSTTSEAPKGGGVDLTIIAMAGIIGILLLAIIVVLIRRR